MRYNTGHAEVRAEGFSQQTGFSIMASGKAFKGLIDGLYSRKIEAIIRELSTNAFDGQRAAGYVGPFSVHLPSALDPVFWVRDFGTGMTHQQVMTRYPTLFDSTKDGTNAEDVQVNPDEQVGCLGLGSKSFFAYTDACTLTVWQDGEMRVYSIFMGADGVPQVALAGTLPSEEPNGVKVEFAVRTKDFAQFTSAAERVYKGFPILPAGLPITVKQAISIEPLMMGEGWKAFPQDYLPDGGFYARQGCVLYPIDLTQVDGKATEDADGEVTLSSDFSRFTDTNNTVILDFPIGSIGFDLSRERLSYDDRTVAALRQRWGEFNKDLNAQVRKSFRGFRTSFERMAAAFDGPASHFGSLFAGTPESREAAMLRDALWEEFPRSSTQALGETKLFLNALRGPAMTDQAPKQYRHKQAWGGPEKDALNRAAFFIIDEKKPGERKRIGNYMVANNIEWAFTINPARLKPSLYRKLGRPPITRISDMPLPPKPAKGERVSGGYGGGGVFSRFKFLNDDGYTNEEAKDVSDMDLSDHTFMLINRGEIIHPVMGYDGVVLEDIRLIHKVNTMFKGTSITLINTRSNEPFEKWDAFPKAYGVIDSFVADMSPGFIKYVIDTLNRHRFVQSRYAHVLTQWRAANPYANDPITRLKRFERRYMAIPEDIRKLCNAICDRADAYVTRSYRSSNLFVEYLFQIIERGRAMGLEILPDMDRAGRPHLNTVKADLLPKRWEKVAHFITYPNQQQNAFLAMLNKELSATC